MTLPNFLVIGAGRSGTTSLQAYLAQHPDVFLSPVKAPSHFFCRDLPAIDDPTLRLVTANYFVRDLPAYEALFEGAGGRRAVGEVSPVYLASTHVAGRIAATIPHARLIAILRNPVERVQARFVGRRRDGLEQRDTLEEVVRDELAVGVDTEEAFGTYLAAGFAGRYLATYYAGFPAEQIKVFLHEDLKADGQAVIREMFAFLGVDPDFPVDTTHRHNASGGVIANPMTRAAWTRTALIRARVRRHVPQAARDWVFARVSRDLRPVPLAPHLREELVELFRPDIRQLETLIGRDLGAWLT